MPREIKYWRAVSEALTEEMERDERVCLIGEDVGAPGGAFGASRGLQSRFGPWRVRDTPISEGVITGCAVGAALTGLRPVVEIMFFDFLALAMDQLCNHGAKFRFMSGGNVTVPMTLITMCAAERNSGPQHASSMEAWLAHVPGLKVVWPATPYDAKGLIKSAIRDDNPVVVVTSVGAWTLSGQVPDGDFTVPIGKADIKREGRDITLISVGGALQKVQAAAAVLAADQIAAEVVDLRSISPLDTETLIRSAARTRRALVVHDAVRDFGVGAEVSARLHEALFDTLAAPVARLGAAFAPPPFSPALGKGYWPQVDAIVAAARQLLSQNRRGGVARG